LGMSVSIWNNTILAGANRDDEGGNSAGAAYIFGREETGWVQRAKLMASDSRQRDEFGVSASLYGSTALVGACYDDDDGSASGSVYVFEQDGTTWSQTAKLRATDAAAGDQFGWSVAIEGGTAIVGARNADSESGAVYVFEPYRSVWEEQQEIVATDTSVGDQFGYHSALFGDALVVGAPRDDDQGDRSGAAYVFRRSPAGWSQEAKLLPGDGTEGDFFGHQVALWENRAVVAAIADDGAGGHLATAYVFEKEGTTWTEQAKLVGGATSTLDLGSFATSVACWDGSVLVGARYHERLGPGAGAVDLFQLGESGWMHEETWHGSDTSSWDFFGHAVAIRGGIAAVGAIQPYSTQGDPGAVYVFVPEPSSLFLLLALTAVWLLACVRRRRASKP